MTGRKQFLATEHDSPLGVAVQLGEHRVVAVLEHQVELPFAAEHLDQVDQVAVFELLREREREGKNRREAVLSRDSDPSASPAARHSLLLIKQMVIKRLFSLTT